MSCVLKFSSTCPIRIVYTLSDNCKDDRILRSVLESFITEPFTKSGFSSVGFLCSRLICPVMDSTPLITDGDPLAIWMLSSQEPGI